MDTSDGDALRVTETGAAAGAAEDTSSVKAFLMACESASSKEATIGPKTGEPSEPAGGCASRGLHAGENGEGEKSKRIKTLVQNEGGGPLHFDPRVLVFVFA